MERALDSESKDGLRTDCAMDFGPVTSAFGVRSLHQLAKKQIEVTVLH